MNNPVLILYLEDDPRDVELVQDRLQQADMACELRVARDRAEYEAAVALIPFRFDSRGLQAARLRRHGSPGISEGETTRCPIHPDLRHGG